MVVDPKEVYEQIERLNQQIEELHYSPVLNSDGEIVSYADLLG